MPALTEQPHDVEQLQHEVAQRVCNEARHASHHSQAQILDARQTGEKA